MATTIFKNLIRCMVTGLMGSVLLLWCPAWAQTGPTVKDALARAHDASLPESAITQVLAMAYDADFDRTTAVRFILVLVEAHKMDFKLDPFWERIEEGMAKRIDGMRIALSLEQRLERQIHVNERLRHGRDTADAAYQAAVVSLTDGLEMGLTPPEMDTLLQQAGDAPLTLTAVAAEIWALLKQLDFDPALRERIIAGGLEQRTLKPAWRHFPQIVAIARQKGVSDGKTGAEALRCLQAGGIPADLLARLGFTGRNLREGPMGND